MSTSVFNVSAVNGPPVALVLGGEAELFLYGMIGEYGISAGAFVERLRAIDRSVSVLHLRVNSLGGSVDEARAMATALFEWPGRVIAHVDGVAASSAAFLLLSADEIVMSDGAFLMLHAPWTFTLGDAGEHDRAAVLLRKYEAGLVSAYERRTGVDAETVRGWMEAETWFSADEAVTVGLADRVVPSVAEGEAAALGSRLVFDLSAFRQAPAALIRRFERKEIMSQQNSPASRAYQVTGGVPDSQLPGASGGVAPPPVVQVQGAAGAAPGGDPVAVEQERVDGIYRMTLGLGLPIEMATRAVQGRVRLDLFREAALTERYEREQATNIRSHNGSAHMGTDGVDRTRTAFEEAIYAKLFKPNTPNVDERFRNKRLSEMTATYFREMGYEGVANDASGATLQALGLKPFGGIMGATQRTTDFPQVLGNQLNKFVLDGYQQNPAELKPVARVRFVNDFKTLNVLRAGGLTIVEVPEASDIPQTLISEYSGMYAVKFYAGMVQLTHQAMVNDDVGAFDEMARTAADAAISLEAKLLVDVLLANAGLGQTLSYDSKTLFHADHKNLGVGAALDPEALGVARAAMRKQTGLNGDIIDVKPKFLVVSAAMQTQAERLAATLTANSADNVNPFGGQLIVVAEPRLDASSEIRWYLAADPLRTPCLEIAYLVGQPGPRVESRVKFENESFELKVILEVGAGAVDYRGMYQNPGVAVVP